MPTNATIPINDEQRRLLLEYAANNFSPSSIATLLSLNNEQLAHEVANSPDLGGFYSFISREHARQQANARRSGEWAAYNEAHGQPPENRNSRWDQRRAESRVRYAEERGRNSRIFNPNDDTELLFNTLRGRLGPDAEGLTRYADLVDRANQLGLLRQGELEYLTERASGRSHNTVHRSYPTENEEREAFINYRMSQLDPRMDNSARAAARQRIIGELTPGNDLFGQNNTQSDFELARAERSSNRGPLASLNINFTRPIPRTWGAGEGTEPNPNFIEPLPDVEHPPYEEIDRIRTPSPENLRSETFNTSRRGEERARRSSSRRSRPIPPSVGQTPSNAERMEEEIRGNLAREEARPSSPIGRSEGFRTSPTSAFNEPEPARRRPSPVAPSATREDIPRSYSPLFTEVPLNERSGQTNIRPESISDSDVEDIPMPGERRPSSPLRAPSPQAQELPRNARFSPLQEAEQQARRQSEQSEQEEAPQAEESFSQRFASSSNADRLRRRRARENRFSEQNLRAPRRGRNPVRSDVDTSEGEDDLNYPESWINPAPAYTEPLPAYRPSPETNRRNYISPDRPPLPPVGQSSVLQHGPLHLQEADRAIIEAGLDIASRTHVPYEGNMVAGLSNAEKRARTMLASENPFVNRRVRNEEREIEASIRDIRNSKRAYDVSAPYLKKMTESPDKLHNKLLGSFEREHLKTLKEEADQNFIDKILPEAQRKYMVPGLQRSGGMNRTMRDLIKDYTKGQTSSLNEARMKNRLATFGVSQEHARQQGAAADIAAKNVMQDVEKDTKAVDMLNAANERRRAARFQAAKTQQELGAEERAIEQQKLNEARSLDIEAREAPLTKLQQLSSLIRGTSQPVQTTTIGQLRENPRNNAPNMYQQGAGALAGISGNLMPRLAKKGGVIRARKKYADGGSVMSEAVQNAVLNHEDPLSELRRLMNAQRMNDFIETSVGRRRYASGGVMLMPRSDSSLLKRVPTLDEVISDKTPFLGRVKKDTALSDPKLSAPKRMAKMLSEPSDLIPAPKDPIEEGALKAEKLMGEKNLREHIEVMKAPRRNSMGTSIIDAAMQGIASVGGDGLGTVAKAYTQAAQAKEAELDHARQEKARAMQMHYDLDKESLREEAAARKEAREEARLRRQEQMQDRQFNASQAHHRERMELEGAKMEGRRAPPPKLDEADKEIIKTANKSIMNAPALLEDLDKLDRLSNKIDSGGITTRIPGVQTPFVQSIIGKGTQAEYDEFDKISNDFALKAAASFGSKAGARIAQMFKDAKPNRTMSKEGVQKVILNIKKQIQDEVDRGHFLNDSYQEGVSPKNALSMYERDRNERRDRGEKRVESETRKTGDHELSEMEAALERKRSGR